MVWLCFREWIKHAVSTARTRAMTAYGMPEHPATTVAGDDAYCNDTDAVL